MAFANDPAPASILFRYGFNPLTNEFIQPAINKDFRARTPGVYTIEASDNTLRLFSLRIHENESGEFFNKPEMECMKYTVVNFFGELENCDRQPNSHIESLRQHTRYFCTPITLLLNVPGDETNTAGTMAYGVHKMQQVFDIIREIYIKGNFEQQKMLVISDLDETIGKDTPKITDGKAEMDSELIEDDYFRRLEVLQSQCPDIDFVIITNTAKKYVPGKAEQLGLDQNHFKSILGKDENDNVTKQGRVKKALSGADYSHVFIIDDFPSTLKSQVKSALDALADPKKITPIQFLSGITHRIKKNFLIFKLQAVNETESDLQDYLNKPANKAALSKYYKEVGFYKRYGHPEITGVSSDLPETGFKP